MAEALQNRRRAGMQPCIFAGGSQHHRAASAHTRAPVMVDSDA